VPFVEVSPNILPHVLGELRRVTVMRVHERWSRERPQQLRMDLSLPDYLWGGVSASSISSADRRTGIQKYKNDALKIIKEFVDAVWNCRSSMSRATFPKADTATGFQNHKVAVLHR
jgi:hypothetical protein